MLPWMCQWSSWTSMHLPWTTTSWRQRLYLQRYGCIQPNNSDKNLINPYKFSLRFKPNEKFWGIWTTDTHEYTLSIILSTQRSWLNRFIMIFTDCGPPPSGLGLRISNTILRGTSSGAEVRYECNEIGYALNGTGTSNCRLDGTWSDTPTCQSKAFIILHKVKVTLKKRTTPKKWE